MAIRYDSKLKSDLQSTVRNFNAKINRLKKLDRNLQLPESVSIKDLKSKYTNRKDLKREIENLKLFSTRGIEESVTTKGGVTLSKYELELAKRNLRSAKSYLTREIKRREATKIKTFGVTEDVTYAEIGSRSYLNLKARRKALNKDISSLSGASFTNFMNLIEKSRNKMIYDYNNLQYNWANEMLMPVAYMSGYDMSKLDEVNRKIASLDERNFIKLFNDEELMKTITEAYRDLKDGRMDEQEIDNLHEILDRLSSDIDVIIKDYV